MARVLVTGGSGLIGRRTVEAFAGSEDIVIPLGRSDGDLLAPGGWERLLDRHRPDTIVHLAWSASALADYRDHDDNWRWAEVTVSGVRLALERGIRFIATGTSVDDVDASDAYSRSKAEARAALADQIAARKVAWLRPFYVFDEDRPSPAVLRAALAARGEGRPVRLASPDAFHDFIDARDVGAAIRMLVEHNLAGPLDLGSGRLTSVADLVAAFGCTWVSDGVVSPSGSTSTAADISGLIALGWVPTATAMRLDFD